MKLVGTPVSQTSRTPSYRHAPLVTMAAPGSDQPLGAALRVVQGVPTLFQFDAQRRDAPHRQLDPIVSAGQAHHHEERPHQAKDNVLLTGDCSAPLDEGAIQCRMRLGGLLKHYYRQAA